MAELSRTEAKHCLREAGLRATAPRMAVLRLLASAERPLSHSEVVEAIGTEEFDQATLYRNLLKLVEAKLARVASRISGISRYEACGEDDGPHLHPHFACRTCGTVECLPETTLSGAIDERWKRSLESSEMQLVGDCPKCIG